MKKRVLSYLFVFFLLMTGCGNKTTNTDNEVDHETIADASTEDSVSGEFGSSDVSGTSTIIDASDMFTDRDYEVDYKEEDSAVITLNNNAATCDSDAVQVTDSTVTITDEGTYILSGILDDGMIVVNAEKTDKVQLVLNGINVHSENSAAIYILQADKVFVTMAADSENALSNGGQFTAIDENNIDAVVFSKEDLTFNGTGSLKINSPVGHGVVSKDDLAVTGGTYSIIAASHGLSGKDSVRIAEGSFAITAGKDGIHAENTDDTSLGFLYIAGGTYQITAEGDGISASGSLQMEDGTFEIVTGGGSASAIQERNKGWQPFREDNTSDSSEDQTSVKGIKASSNLVVNGGTFSIDSADDAVHSKMSLTVNSGTYAISSGDDGFHADDLLAITGGEINITQSYEGIEGLKIEISGGDITLTASDDGVNAAGGNDQSGEEGFRGKDTFDTDSDSYINILGGVLNIDAAGDGIDSNGYITVSGGETYVAGPVNGGNGALDYGLEAKVTGGILIASGTSQMAETFCESSTQGVIFVTFDTQSGGSMVELEDSSGATVLSWQAGKDFESVVVTCPQIVQDGTYTLTAGKFCTQITMVSLLYGSGGGMGQPGGEHGVDQLGGKHGVNQPGGKQGMGQP